VSRTSSTGRRYVATALLAVLAIVVVLGGLVALGMSQGRDSITRRDRRDH
jgi:hypothetical protein